MLCLHVIPGFGQSFSYVFSDHYRTMLSAGTPKSDCQIALAFADVVRHEVNEQVRDAIDELLRLRKLPNIRCNLRMFARQWTKLRNKMRVRQKTHIEYQVGIVRHSVLETETDARNKDRLAARAFLKLVNNVRAQFVDVELRGVDDHIRKVAQEIKPLAFRADRGRDR